MIAENLLTDEMAPLRLEDKGSEALTIMNLFGVRHLPLVNHDDYVGIVGEDDVLAHDLEEHVATYDLQVKTAFVKNYDHIYEIMRMMAEKNLTVIPVVSDDHKYLGMISQNDLLSFFANTSSFAEPGSIVVLEVGKRDYSLAEISRIVESENTKILSSFITSRPDSQKIDVTLKLSAQSIQNVLATLERFEYVVKASFDETDYLDSLKERYDALMTFLNV